MRIFISYRRDDLAARALSGRIHDVLAKRYGAANVFLDEIAIPPGVDFREVLRGRVTAADVLLVLIGPQWGALFEGRNTETDFVEYEVQTAIESGLRVVPMLIAGASMPKETSLPPNIRSFSYLNARPLDPGADFQNHMRRLIRELDGGSEIWRTLRWAAAALLLLLATAAAGLHFSGVLRPNLGKTSVLIVMGENVPYEREMADAFVERLRRGIESRGGELVAYPRIVPRFESTYASPDSTLGAKTWNDVTADIRATYAPGSVDYFITLGTFASQAVKTSKLIYEIGAKGLIYLGVTDPKKADLVGNFKITGVRYGTGGIDFGRRIDELFLPDQNLVFIYQKQEGNIQDQSIASDLLALNNEFAKDPKRKKDRFVVRPIEGLIDVAKLNEADPSAPTASEVYFAWYGLDNILALENRSSLENTNLWIVPSTYSPKNIKLAGVVVSVNDAEVGRLGADIVLHHLEHPDDLGRHPIVSPPFHVWLKLDTLARKGMKLAPNAYTQQQNPAYTYE